MNHRDWWTLTQDKQSKIGKIQTYIVVVLNVVRCAHQILGYATTYDTSTEAVIIESMDNQQQQFVMYIYFQFAELRSLWTDVYSTLTDHCLCILTFIFVNNKNACHISLSSLNRSVTKTPTNVISWNMAVLLKIPTLTHSNFKWTINL